MDDNIEIDDKLNAVLPVSEMFEHYKKCARDDGHQYGTINYFSRHVRRLLRQKLAISNGGYIPDKLKTGRKIEVGGSYFRGMWGVNWKDSRRAPAKYGIM